MTTKNYEQRKEANKKYLSKLDTFVLRLPKGRKDEIRTHAEEHNESVNGFITRAIDETIVSDNAKDAAQTDGMK